MNALEKAINLRSKIEQYIEAVGEDRLPKIKIDRVCLWRNLLDALIEELEA